MNSIAKSTLPALFFVAFSVLSASSQRCLYTFNGDSEGEWFGYSVSGAGDVNKDGYDDLIVGAYRDDNYGTYSGSARVFSGKNGSVLYTFNGGTAGDFFGISVSGAGDVNKDGYDDLIVGASQVGMASGGYVKIFSGMDGSVLKTFIAIHSYDQFGFSVSGAGDVNKDGYDDVIVGATRSDSNAPGYAQVFSGIDGTELYNFPGFHAGDHFGCSVSCAGDVNKDGYPDVIVGAYRRNTGFDKAGSARVFSGKTGGLLAHWNGYAVGDYFGWSVSGVGDVNKDGYDDCVIGVPRQDSNGTDAGAAWVHSGDGGAFLIQVYGDSAGDNFGTSVGHAGDVNKDGYPDFIVGAPYGGKNGGGYARIFSGQNGSVLLTIDGDSGGDWFGCSVSGAGDVNKDGYDDVIVGANKYFHAPSDGYARVFSLVGKVYYVSATGSDSNSGITPYTPFRHIQHAISLSTSVSTIYVAPGVYNELLTIQDKDLTLEGGVNMPGVSPGETVVEMPSNRTPGSGMKISDYAVLKPGWNMAQQADPTLWIQDTTPASPGMVVNISNITFDGLNQSHTCSGDYFYTAVVYKSCSGLISDCTVKRYTNAQTSTEFGCGIWVDCDASSLAYRGAANVTIHQCTFRDNKTFDIRVCVGTAHIRNCDIQVAGSAGIYFCSHSGGSIQGNQITGFDSSTAQAVLVFAPNNILDLSGNHIHGCLLGVKIGYYYNGTGVSPQGPYRIAGNVVGGCGTGLWTDISGKAHFEGNVLLPPSTGGKHVEDVATTNTWVGNHFHDLPATLPAIWPDAYGVKDPDPRPVASTLVDSTTPIMSLTSPRGMVAADYNGDTHLDVAVVNNGANTVTVHYGDGAGGFQTPPQTIAMPTVPIATENPVSIATGKFDDGDTLDLAVACESGHVVTVFNTGSGTSCFGTSIVVNITGSSLQATDRPADIAAGDLDGSSKDDLLVALSGNLPIHRGGGLVLINPGTGGTTFTGTRLLGEYSAAHGCALADLDGDNDLDAIVCESGTAVSAAANEVKVFVNNGSGAFPVAEKQLDPGLDPQGVTAADLDGDGLPEIVVANFGDPLTNTPGTVAVFLNEYDQITGLDFSSPVQTNAGLGTTSVLVFDALHDSTAGNPRFDVAAVNWWEGSVTLLEQWSPAGNGFLRTKSFTGVGFPRNGMAVGDLDKDGSDDLFVTSEGTGNVHCFKGTLSAQLVYYGRGAMGQGGRIPVISIEGGVPVQPRLNFAITLANARPYVPALLVGSLNRANPLPAGPGLLFQTLDWLRLVFVNSAGAGRAPLMIPEAAVIPLKGLRLYWQWGIFDTEGEFPDPVGGFALSNGLEMRIGE